MNRLIRLNKATVISLIVALIACFGPLQNARGQNPCPTNCINNNTAIGGALQAITTGRFNTGTGYVALNYNTTGNRNTATGYAALLSNTTASDNTANGAYALNKNTVGANNTAIGTEALINNTTGSYNAATAVGALQNNTTGDRNTANGYNALFRNHIGGFNTATGANALDNNTIGGNNTATGFNAISANTTGNFNAAFGSAALAQSTTGSGNTAVGYAALYSFTTGRQNTALGYFAGSNVTTANDVICIGSTGANVNSSTWIGNIYGVSPQSGPTAPVIVSAGGQLGTVASSERFKKDVAPMDKTSEAILSLRPVTFHYKTDTEGAPQFGLIAEEVAKVNPELVLPDKEGKPYTVRYDAVNAMLLNEFLKEHHKVESLEKAMAEQQKENAAMRAMLKEQAEQIQKVSAQLELSKTAPQTVLNNQ
jgi:Chaperone of endosialidase